MKTTGYLRAVTGVPDADRRCFVLEMTYRDNNDHTQKTIALDVESELASLAAVCKAGIEWYSEQARDEDELLRREW